MRWGGVAALGGLVSRSFSWNAIKAQVRVIYDEEYGKLQARHIDRGYPHPECPARVTNAAKVLREGDLPLEWVSPGLDQSSRARALKALQRVHSEEHIATLRDMCAKGVSSIDADTYLTSDSFEVCLATTDSWIRAITSAVQDDVPAFALARPPGHHATRGSSMGFCIFNFAAAAAAFALEELGCGRVAIFDFDVHHGNGIANIFRMEPRVRYCSIHQGGIFPMTGDFAEDLGPKGNIRSFPLFFDLNPITWKLYRPIFEEKAIPWLQEFKPDVLLISAGYDSLACDELASMSLEEENFGEMAHILQKAFGRRLCFGLEGGYDLDAIARAIEHTLRPLTET
ncbi:unnamed protein product [Chrysoparadoxa australica]